MSSNQKRLSESQGMDDIFKQVIILCADNQDSKPKGDSGGSILLEDLPIKDFLD